jgi:ornithine--oxo-acid transaminase
MKESLNRKELLNGTERHFTSAAEDGGSYANYVNPTWVKLLDALGMNVRYTHCSGLELYTADGRTILDCLSGYCVHNVGHNHPFVIAELVAELQSQIPSMLQSSVVKEAVTLAQMLCENADGKVSKIFFCSSGGEGVETVIKFARAHTGRTDLVYASGAFHGLTCGALSLIGNDFWRESFGPMLDGTHEVPFGDLAAMEKRLATKTIAAVILEPIQAEGGIVLPPAHRIDLAVRFRKAIKETLYGIGQLRDTAKKRKYHRGTVCAQRHSRQKGVKA